MSRLSLCRFCRLMSSTAPLKSSSALAIISEELVMSSTEYYHCIAMVDRFYANTRQPTVPLVCSRKIVRQIQEYSCISLTNQYFMIAAAALLSLLEIITEANCILLNISLHFDWNNTLQSRWQNERGFRIHSVLRMPVLIVARSVRAFPM